MELYPVFNADEIEDKFPKLTAFLKFIVRSRKDDVQAFNNLPQIFISGRKVGKIPGASTSVVATDRPGDFNYDDQYIYILTTDAMGDPAWGRSLLDTSW